VNPACGKLIEAAEKVEDQQHRIDRDATLAGPNSRRARRALNLTPTMESGKEFLKDAKALLKLLVDKANENNQFARQFRATEVPELQESFRRSRSFDGLEHSPRKLSHSLQDRV